MQSFPGFSSFFQAFPGFSRLFQVFTNIFSHAKDFFPVVYSLLPVFSWAQNGQTVSLTFVFPVQEQLGRFVALT